MPTGLLSALVTAAALTLSTMAATGALGAAPLTPGTISIETQAADPDLRAAAPAFVNALIEALDAKGFTTLEQPGHAAYVADLILTRTNVGTGTAKVPASHSSASPGVPFNAVGASAVIALPTGKSQLVPLQRTQLELRIHKRGDPTILWQGTAMTVRTAETPKGRDTAVAADLTAGLFRAYPTQPEAVVSVP